MLPQENNSNNKNHEQCQMRRFVVLCGVWWTNCLNKFLDESRLVNLNDKLISPKEFSLSWSSRVHVTKPIM